MCCGAQAEDSIYIRVFNLPFGVAHYSSIEISFMSSVQALYQTVLGWYVEKIKSGVSHAEFHKYHVLSMEVSSLKFLSLKINHELGS